MTKIEMLTWGCRHIAHNHGFKFAEDIGQVCVYGGCNVPLLADLQMLCDDLNIPRDYIESGECGVDIFIPDGWDAESEYEKGLELWRRKV